MRLIGYWIESLLDTSYVPPQELVGPLPDDVQRAVANYLNGGEEYERYRGISWCRFFCDHQMGSREFSDGRWVWPEDLGHYVRDHGVVLPEEFVRDVLEGSPPVPKSRWECSPVNLDHDFWRSWCRANRSGRCRPRLEEAKRRADAEAERLLDATVAELEAREGLSSERCHWVDCTNRALSRRAHCARCSFRGQDFLPHTAVYHDLSWALGVES